jgi:CxxC-x17-CxxC domain-containing protein
MANNEINFFGLTNFRNQKKRFGIKTDDRRRHFYCIGKTGMGKSNLMENMAIQDIQAGHGIAYVDPHGEGAEKLLDFIPQNRINDVVFFNPADLDYPIAFNVMEKVDFRFRHLVAGGLMGVFKKVWPDVWSARMEYILNNSILALLEYPDSTLLGVNRMLADPEYREKVVSKITDPIVKSFWVTEYARYTQRYEIEATAAIQNKVGQFISNPLIRNIIGQTKSTINMRDIMDKQKIFIMDLSKGRIGEDNSRLLGALLITKLQLAAMSRVDIPEDERKDFYLYVDEFQNFATESFANILSEARKYRLDITLGHQYIAQMDELVRDAVFGNVGTLAVFRVGAEDAEFLEKEFSPEFTAEDLVNLPKYNIYLKLMIDGVAGHPFSAETLPPPIPLEESNREKIIKTSRERYGVKRDLVEEKIARWSGFGEEEEQGEKKQGNSQNQGAHQKPQQPKTFTSGSQAEQTVLYDAICSSCGKQTKVIFPPDAGRSVFCKSCLKKMKAAKEEAKIHHEESVKHDENVKIENISFATHRRHDDKKDDKSHNNQQPHKRKEINLEDLKKALEESLEKSNEELEERIEQEKGEDKMAPNEKKVVENDKENNNKKKEIKPGQKINL